ncbi:MAG: calcium-binding protein, partial [Allosphingosinicella sp.]
ASTDYIFGGQGGDIIRGGLRGDTLHGHGGDDRFEAVGAAELSGDRIDGGAGIDTLALSGGVTFAFAADTMVGVERVLLGSAGGAGYSSYNLTLHNANVAAGQTLTVDGSGLLRGETMMVYGSGESDGRFVLLGGANNDYLHGGAGNDRIQGGLGRDQLRGNGGADTFAYASAADSTGTGFDQLVGFDWREDRIDLPGAVSGWNGSASGTLSAASFNADLAAAADAALQGNGALLFTANAGNYAGRAFLVVDGNGDGAYTAGQDYVLELVNPAAPLPGTAEFFI